MGLAEDRVKVRAFDRPVVSGESELLRGAIGNLVRNALTYSSEERRVVVSVARRNGTAIVSVSDRGPGISDEERDTIFDPFVRGRVGRASGSGGGLGLFIVRRVAEAHGGTVRLESHTGETTFHIEIPVHR